MQLYKASRQWSSRPDDERFASLPELIAATKAYAHASRTKVVTTQELRTEAINGDLALVGRAGVPAKLSNWSFGQVCAKVGAPAKYLRELPATLAAQNLNHGFKHLETESNSKLLFNIGDNHDLTLRAINGEDYGRIWNYEVAERILPHLNDGWKVPRAMDSDQRPAGLYASDRDMFIFLVNEAIQINDGSGEAVYRGMFIENSEVGAKSLRFTRFLYQRVCGNHIVWGARNVTELAIRHVGDVDTKFRQRFALELQRLSNESASDEEAKIASARRKVIAATKEEVLDMIFGRKIMTRKAATLAYDLAEQFEREHTVAPNTVWGFVQGVTRLSQQSPYADERTELDRAAGRVLEMAF